MLLQDPLGSGLWRRTFANFRSFFVAALLHSRTVAPHRTPQPHNQHPSAAPPPASAYRAHRPNLESSLDAWERLLASWRIPYFDPSARGAPAPAVVRERVRQCLAPMFAQRPPPAPHNELIDNFGRAKDVLLRLGFGPYLRPPPGGSGESTAR